MRPTRWLVVAALTLAVASALASGNAPSGEIPNFEEARYSVSWGVVPAGKGMFRARAVGDGYTLRAQICSTGLVDVFHSVRDQLYTEVERGPYGLRPSYHRLTQIEQGERKETIVDFLAPDRVRILKRKEGKRKKEKVQTVPEGIRDTLSIIYAVRRLPLEVGETYRLPLLDGTDIETLVVPVKGRRELKGHEVLEVRPYTMEDGEREEGGEWALFLTDDDRRVPVRMKLALSFGKLHLEMTDYRGHGSVKRPARMFCDKEVTMPR
ncbi:DUF3108 domain-containing protein [Thiohalorhabdus sp.]|uniref:DUF3108 domain-containing protein n=1 Tax=Thiohalorhabdus sp. TaxID=3094134 RepID=UPI002FC39D20